MSQAKMFESVSFEDAVKLFKQWGFIVEPGPRPEEVTLILEGQTFKTYSVHPAALLSQLAAATLHVRWQNGAMAGAPATEPQDRAKKPAVLPLPIRTHSLLVH